MRRSSPGPSPTRRPTIPRFHYGWSELFSVETARWKFVRAPRPELYDLTADPKQTHDVSAQHPGIAATLSAQLDASSPDVGKAAPAPAKLDPEATARLRSLGYVSGGESTAQQQTGPRPDPKDKMPLLQELLRAQSLGDAGQFDAAAQILDIARAQASRESCRSSGSVVRVPAAWRRAGGRRDGSARRRARSRICHRHPEPCVRLPGGGPHRRCRDRLPTRPGARFRECQSPGRFRGDHIASADRASRPLPPTSVPLRRRPPLPRFKPGWASSRSN